MNNINPFVDIWIFGIICILIFILLTYYSHSSNPNIKIDFNATLAIARQNDDHHQNPENLTNENIPITENNNCPMSCPIIRTPKPEIISPKRIRRPPIRFADENYY